MTEPESVTPSGGEGTPVRLGRVLVATDFSETAEVAVGWAIEVARRHGAALHMVHALTLPAPIGEYVPATADFGQELLAVARTKLAAAAEEARAAGLEVELEVPIGVPSQSILRTAEEIGADLVVVGTRGLTGFAHLLLGSTAERVVQRARCPVLTVHPGDAPRRRIRTIVAPTDFSAGAERAARVAHTLLRGFEDHARLVLVHAFHMPIEYTAYGPIPTAVGYLSDVGADAQERLDLLAGGFAREGLTVETVAREGYAPDVIVEEATARNADLVAMGTHGRTGLAHLLLGSTAERVVQHAPCPVMTVRQDEE